MFLYHGTDYENAVSICNEKKTNHKGLWCTNDAQLALRYGISKGLSPLQEDFKFNIDNLITNTMFLFNVVDEYIICKYRYNRNE